MSFLYKTIILKINERFYGLEWFYGLMMAKKLRFSFVELLIVVSVLTILMTLMVKSLNSTLQKSREVHCRHNLKNLGQSSAIFSDAHNDDLPINGYSTVNQYGTSVSTHAGLLWKFQIGDYVYGKTYQYYSTHSQDGVEGGYEQARAFKIHQDLSTKTFECPNVWELQTAAGFEYNDIVNWRRGGYGINGLLKDSDRFSSTQGVIVDNSIKVSHVDLPYDTVLIADSLHSNVSTTFPQALRSPSFMTFGNRNFNYDWHNNGINLLWTDMHVSHMYDEEIKLGQNGDQNYYFKANKED